MPVSAARRLALRALGNARRTGRWVRDALRSEAERANVPARDRALAWRLAMGATAARGLLEERIRGVARRSSAIQPQVLDALRLGAFELLYLETPVPVAVSEGVELVRGVAPRAAGFANAILHRLAPLREEVHGARGRIAAGRSAEGDLRLVSALPPWLLEELGASLTAEALRALCRCTLEPAPRWVARVGEGRPIGSLEPTPIPGAYLEGGQGPSGTGAADAPLIHSDLAAQTVALLTVPPAGASRLEIGMGRGTKTLIVARALAEAGEGAELVGVEPDARRLRWARRAFAAHADAVATHRADGRHLDEVPELGGRRFDLVFLDAPCSGTGTLRRHPEIAWSLGPGALDPEASDSLVGLQADLLASAARHVAPGGSLAYATCSVLKQENAERIASFLASDAGRPFEPVDVRETPGYRRLPEGARALVDGALVDGALRTLPAGGGPDGHYLRILRR